MAPDRPPNYLGPTMPSNSYLADRSAVYSEAIFTMGAQGPTSFTHAKPRPMTDLGVAPYLRCHTPTS
jgi:hypothetical protein